MKSRSRMLGVTTLGRCLGAALSLVVAGDALAADGAIPAPPSLLSGKGRVVFFKNPDVWPDSPETWSLVDDVGKVICYLPCAARVQPSSGDQLEGLRIASDGNGKTHVADMLTHRVDLGGFDESGPPLVARMLPATGDSKAAIAVGVASAVVLATGLTLFAVAAAESHDNDPGQGSLEATAALPVIALGAVLGVVAITWSRASEPPRLELTPLRTAAAPAGGLRVALAPFGAAASF